MRAFASDNYAPALPEVLEAIVAANAGHVVSYGADPVTARLDERVREHFGADAVGFPVFNGTAANVVGLRAMLRPWQGVICAESAHLNVDEGGAPEAIAGTKLLTVPTPDGKLDTELVERRMKRIGDEHVVQPGVVSITESTELGTVYTVEEMAALAEYVRAREMLLHVDGSRLANAAAARDVGLRELTEGVGADVVSFGGTKVGLLAAELVVILNPSLPDALPYLRKQSMRLASKMRFVSAQLEALLTDDLWRRSASHANSMARRLADAITAIDGVELAHPVEANGVFANLPTPAIDRLREALPAAMPFYVWDEEAGTVRLMCSWDTTAEDVDELAAALGSAIRDVG